MLNKIRSLKKKGLLNLLSPNYGSYKFTMKKEPFSKGDTERCIEIPWALSCYRGESRVLDIGYANAEERYLKPLLALRIPELYGVDLARKDIDGIIPFICDIRKTSFIDEFFDLVLCVSTIEHIGRNNSIYLEVQGDFDEYGDFAAIKELYRITRRGGRMVLTVPFGKLHDYGWFIHYDRYRWSNLIKASKYNIVKEEFFIYKDGWRTSSPHELETVLYKDNNAPAAAGLVCALLSK